MDFLGIQQQPRLFLGVHQCDDSIAFDSHLSYFQYHLRLDHSAKIVKYLMSKEAQVK